MDIKTLNNDSASPLYRQLMQRLRGDIASGVYPAHSRIPSEQELCTAYQVSRVTVRKALAELTREGLLRRMQGKGTFVCAPRIRKNLRDVTSFHDACRVMGCTAGTKVISAQIVPAEDEIREELLLEGDKVVEIVRLRLADAQPVMLETNRFPLTYDSLIREDLTGSLYALLEVRGVEAANGIHEVSLCYATPAQARLLGVNPGDALLQLDQVIYDQHGAPLHTSHQVIRGDRFTFRI
ncbi:MAG: GntR family transcriptional regulator [Clostridia bacterium]|nr:GntR family transcriptional regulator [Clostridia bacterium]